MVRFASLFNMVEQTVTFLSGKRYSLDTLRSLGAGELLNSMCEFSEKLAALQLDSEEMSLFTAVVLVSAGKNNSRNMLLLLQGSKWTQEQQIPDLFYDLLK